jgi:hypothetical protein
MNHHNEHNPASAEGEDNRAAAGVAYPVSVGTRLGTAHYERLARAAEDWGVKPSVMARVLIVQGLQQIAREEQAA